MKYKVGDRVRIRSDLVLGKKYGSINCLLGHKKESGKIFTISCSSEHSEKDYRLNGNNYWWSDEMFEEVNKMIINIESAGKIVTAQMGDKYGVAKCSPEDEFNLFTGAKLALERLEKQCNPYAWLKPKCDYWIPDFDSASFCRVSVWMDSRYDKLMLSRGIVFRTREEAIEAAKKMLAILKEG